MLIDKRIHWIDIKQLHLYKHYIKSLFIWIEITSNIHLVLSSKGKKKREKKRAASSCLSFTLASHGNRNCHSASCSRRHSACWICSCRSAPPSAAQFAGCSAFGYTATSQLARTMLQLANTAVLLHFLLLGLAQQK